MAEDNRHPDVGGHQGSRRLDDRAEPQRHRDLRDHRDVERAARVAGPLQTSGIAQRDRDEEARYAQIPKQLTADGEHQRIRHAERGKQVLRDQQERRADDGGSAESDQ